MTEIQQHIYAEYLRHLKLHGRSCVAPKSVLKMFFAYLNDAGLDLYRLRIKDAEEFQTHLSTKTKADNDAYYRKASILTIIGTLTSFYEYLKKRNRIASNPFVEIQRVKRSKALPRNILTEEKMDAFLKHLRRFREGADEHERRMLYKTHVIAELMYATGMRINELVKIRPDDVDFTRSVVKITDSKTGTTREVIVGTYAEKVLRIYYERIRVAMMAANDRANAELLFGAEAALKRRFNEVINRESERLGYGRFVSHNFRHAVGWHLLKNGCDIRYIQEIMGHKQITTTQVYTRVDKEDLKGVLDTYHPRANQSSIIGD